MRTTLIIFAAVTTVLLLVFVFAACKIGKD